MLAYILGQLQLISVSQYFKLFTVYDRYMSPISKHLIYVVSKFCGLINTTYLIMAITMATENVENLM